MVLCDGKDVLWVLFTDFHFIENNFDNDGEIFWCDKEWLIKQMNKRL